MAFRLLVRKYNCQLCFTQMFHSTILSTKRDYFYSHFSTTSADSPLVIQVSILQSLNGSCVETIQTRLPKPVDLFFLSAKTSISIWVVLRELLGGGDMVRTCSLTSFECSQLPVDSTKRVFHFLSKFVSYRACLILCDCAICYKKKGCLSSRCMGD